MSRRARMKNTILPEPEIAAQTRSVTWVATAKARDCSSGCCNTLKPHTDGQNHDALVDNSIIHKSHETQRWLKANPKLVVIYQPIYSPWVNYVERLCQALHNTITRNHQYHSIWQLLKKVRYFMETASLLPGGKHRWQKCSGIKRSYLACFSNDIEGYVFKLAYQVQ